jgi:hypothetical protein
VTPEPSSDACLKAQRSLLRAPLRVGCAGTCLGGYAPCLIEEARGRLQCQGGGSSLQGVSPTPASRADVYSVTANAARHARSDGAPVTLTVYADDRTMRVEVGDGGPGFEPELLRPPDTDRSGGWGIPMVAAPIGGCRKGKANDGVVRDRPPGPRDAGRRAPDRQPVSPSGRCSGDRRSSAFAASVASGEGPARREVARGLDEIARSAIRASCADGRTALCPGTPVLVAPPSPRRGATVPGREARQHEPSVAG